VFLAVVVPSRDQTQGHQRAANASKTRSSAYATWIRAQLQRLPHRPPKDSSPLPQHHLLQRLAPPTRNVQNLPIITVIGGNIITIEATTDAAQAYADAGASCFDQVDGDLTHTIVTTGTDTVSSAPSTEPAFVIYSCANNEGKTQTATRTVFVKDTQCPQCAVVGKAEAIVEASFPFTDEGVHCVDNFSHDVKVFTTGSVDVEAVGTYKLTYKAEDDAGNWNNGDAKDGERCLHPSGALIRTVTVVDTLKPVIALKYREHVLSGPAASEQGSETGDSTTVVQRASELNDLSFMVVKSTQKFSDEQVAYAMASLVTGLALVGFIQSSQRQRVAAEFVDV